jgi:hypothetical protein
MAEKGHEDAFPPPRLSGRCRFSHGTFAGTRGNGEDAPIPAIRVATIGRLEATEAVRKRSRANKAQNCFLYCPSSDRGDSAIRLYIDEIEEDFLRSD